MVKRFIVGLVAGGMVVFLLGIEQAQIEREQEMRIILEEKVKSLDKHLQAYEDKVNDLSVAFINHHGDYPRRMR